MDRLAVAALLFSIAVAGCLGAPVAPTPTDSPTPPAGTSPPTDPAGTPTATDPAGTPTAPATSPPSTTGSGNVSVEYVVRAGSIADEVAHVYVDFAVYFAEQPGDIYTCTDGAPLLDNRYDPTATPLPTAAGRCEAFDAPRVDLATLDGSRSLGRFEVSALFSGAHTLVVHDVTVVLENGTTASAVYDTDFRAVTERAAPSGTHGVEIGVTDYRGSDNSLRWRFGVDVERFDPSAD